MPDLDIRPAADVPAAVTDLVRHFAGVLGLDHWRIWITLQDRLDNNATADTEIDTAYLVASIAIRRGFVADPGDLLPVVVLHELLHVALDAQDAAVQEIVALLATAAPALVPLAERLWCQADEQTTERLARVLVGRVGPPA